MFLQMRIPPPNLLSSMPNLRYVLGDFEPANRGEISVDELLHILGSFGRHTQEEMTKNRHGIKTYPKFFRLTAETRRLRERLDQSDADRH